jgi:bis(5'-nucleosidyl)-tetraphosphatase
MQSRLSCGVVPVVRSEKEWRYLLLRAYRYWDFPKGVREPAEEPEATALRELQEETGIKRGHFLAQKTYYETLPYSQNKIARYYLFEVTGTEVSLGKNSEGIYEHHEFRWVTFQEAQKLLVPRVKEVLLWARSKLALL